MWTDPVPPDQDLNISSFSYFLRVRSEDEIIQDVR